MDKKIPRTKEERLLRIIFLVRIIKGSVMIILILGIIFIIIEAQIANKSYRANPNVIEYPVEEFSSE